MLSQPVQSEDRREDDEDRDRPEPYRPLPPAGEDDRRRDGEVEESRIMGRVIMEKGTRIRRSVVKGPCIIGRDSIISDSYIGPYTSIGIGCQICGTEVEDSIIMDESRIVNAGKVVESLIGRNVRIKECDSLPRGSRMIVGDNSDISL